MKIAFQISKILFVCLFFLPASFFVTRFSSQKSFPKSEIKWEYNYLNTVIKSHWICCNMYLLQSGQIPLFSTSLWKKKKGNKYRDHFSKDLFPEMKEVDWAACVSHKNLLNSNCSVKACWISHSFLLLIL